MKIILTISFVLFGFLLYSQDTIQYKNEDPIEVDILKISKEKLEYRFSNYENGPIIVVGMEELIYISLNGQPYFAAQEKQISQESGSIMRERRHYFALGVPVGIHFNPGVSGQGSIGMQAEGVYFITPVFGLGGIFSLSSSSITTNQSNFDMRFDASKLTHLLLVPTFAIPLKNFSLNFRAFGGIVSAKTKEGFGNASIYDSDPANTRFTDPPKYILNNYSYTWSEASTTGYSMGAGISMQFNLTKKNPLTFSVGLDYIRDNLNIQTNLLRTAPNGAVVALEDKVHVRQNGIKLGIMLVYQFNAVE